MKTTLTRCKLELKQSPIHGYGVFADQDIAVGETIEECYMLASHRQDPAFNNYYFASANTAYLPLGFGSIYNHADQPNAEFLLDRENRIMHVFARQPIKAGDEIFISYGKDWFGFRKMKSKPVSWSFRLLSLSYVYRFMAILGILFLFRFFQH
jgi:SET domain-containing protein